MYINLFVSCFQLLFLFFISISIGIPFFAGISVYLRRNQLDEAEIKESIGFLYSDYERRYYLWELVIILRLVAMASIGVIFEGKY